MFAVAFIAVFGSSIVGANLFGVSLNKLALIPLEIYLVIRNGRNLKFHINKRQRQLIYWYAISCFASLSGIIFSSIYNVNVVEEVTKRAILQLTSYFVIFIPIALMLWNSKNKYEYAECFKVSLIWTARIQAIWGILQFVLMQTVRYDLNAAILGGIFGGEWTRYSNIANSSIGVVMRVTGINRDAAFLGLLLFIGFIIDSKLIFRFLYIICALLGLSRVALVSCAFIVFYQIYVKLKSNGRKYARAKQLAKAGIISAVLLICFIQVYQNSPALQEQITRVIERFSTISTGADGTSRHIGYPIAMLQLELFNIPLLQKLIGVGNQCGGILFSYYNDAIEWIGLHSSMLSQNYVWTVESDIASVFLETGIIGGVMYYYFYYMSFRASRKDIVKRSLIIGLFVFGIMYNMAGGSLIQLVYISLFATNYLLTENGNSCVEGVNCKNEYKRKSLHSSSQLL